jgi:hypothetical protein
MMSELNPVTLNCSIALFGDDKNHHRDKAIFARGHPVQSVDLPGFEYHPSKTLNIRSSDTQLTDVTLTFLEVPSIFLLPGKAKDHKTIRAMDGCSAFGFFYQNLYDTLEFERLFTHWLPQLDEWIGEKRDFKPFIFFVETNFQPTNEEEKEERRFATELALYRRLEHGQFLAFQLNIHHTNACQPIYEELARQVIVQRTHSAPLSY